MKYIIKLEFINLHIPQYIGNGAYNVACERYIVLTERPEEAKKYTSYNKAKTAIEKMLDSYKYTNLTTEYTICGIDEQGNLIEYPKDYKKE